MSNLSTLEPDYVIDSKLSLWSPFFVKLTQLADKPRYIVPLLFLLGLIRAAFLFLAYAPADGADAMTYYLYAAYMDGVSLPSFVSDYSPAYPFFVYIHRYLLGNFSLLFVSQFFMSSLLGVIYYWGLRRYHAVIAFVVALVIIGDAQLALNFNFASTEPLYIFLLALIFALSMQLRSDVSWQEGLFFAVLTGIALALLNQTRMVAILIVVPVAVLVSIKTRNIWQIGSLLVAYGLMLLLFTGILSLRDARQSGVANQVMYLNWLRETGALSNFEPLSETTFEEASSTQELQQVLTTCQETSTTYILFDCMKSELGNQQELTAVLQRAYMESVLEQFQAFVGLMYRNVTDFLRLSGHQMHDPDQTPANAQCADVDARYARMVATYEGHWSGTTIPELQRAALDTTIRDFVEQMCPPTPTVPAFQKLAWYISFQYRSLSRPHPYLWYAALVLLIFFIPRMRHLWYPVFMAGGLLAYHAAVSAAALNVQPRYVVVTNPFKTILILTLVIGLIQQIIIMANRKILSYQTRNNS